MAGCPYTWVRGLFSSGVPRHIDPTKPARNLMVRVVRDGEERVRVSLPARSAKWLIDIIPDEVVRKIRAEDIPLDALAIELHQAEELFPRSIFSMQEEHRQVEIWLE